MGICFKRRSSWIAKILYFIHTALEKYSNRPFPIHLQSGVRRQNKWFLLNLDPGWHCQHKQCFKSQFIFKINDYIYIFRFVIVFGCLFSFWSPIFMSHGLIFIKSNNFSFLLYEGHMETLFSYLHLFRFLSIQHFNLAPDFLKLCIN